LVWPTAFSRIATRWAESVPHPVARIIKVMAASSVLQTAINVLVDGFMVWFFRGSRLIRLAFPPAGGDFLYSRLTCRLADDILDKGGAGLVNAFDAIGIGGDDIREGFLMSAPILYSIGRGALQKFFLEV
jgi:hypothetical protein